MLRRGTIIMSSFLALLLFTAPGWTQARRGMSMGSMSFSHAPGGFVHSSRGFAAFGTGTSVSSMHGFPAFGTGTSVNTSRSVFVPTVNGAAVVAGRGNFTQFSPAAFVSPLANTAFIQSAYNHTLRHVEREAAWGSYYNPYFYGAYGYGGNGYGYGGYGYVNPYLGFGSPAYGYGASNPYVGAANNAAPQPQVAANNNSNSPPAKSTEALKAFGVPVEFGEVKWPLALRLMPPDVKRDLLDKLESQMKIAANQAVNGNASQTLLRESKSTIDNVRGWLRGRRGNMAESTYQDGDAFLRNLEDSLRRMDS